LKRAETASKNSFFNQHLVIQPVDYFLTNVEKQQLEIK